jgi:restriction system protein
VLTLTQTDGKDRPLIEEVCRTLTQYEELRYTRVQLEPPMNSTVPVRWRQCQ